MYPKDGKNLVVEIRTSILRDIEESIAVTKELAGNCAFEIERAASMIVECLRNGHKLIAFGNGGSAADAEHMVAELVGRYREEKKALAAIALTTNSSAVTAIGNDYGFREIFARQIEALGQPGDVVVAISTSGNSQNILRGLEVAKHAALETIALTGRTGGKMRNLVNVCVSVPADSTPRVQEAHTLIIHILSGIVESRFLSTARETQSNQ